MQEWQCRVFAAERLIAFGVRRCRLCRVSRFGAFIRRGLCLLLVVVGGCGRCLSFSALGLLFAGGCLSLGGLLFAGRFCPLCFASIPVGGCGCFLSFDAGRCCWCSSFGGFCPPWDVSGLAVGVGVCWLVLWGFCPPWAACFLWWLWLVFVFWRSGTGLLPALWCSSSSFGWLWFGVGVTLSALWGFRLLCCVSFPSWLLWCAFVLRCRFFVGSACSVHFLFLPFGPPEGGREDLQWRLVCFIRAYLSICRWKCVPGLQLLLWAATTTTETNNNNNDDDDDDKHSDVVVGMVVLIPDQIIELCVFSWWPVQAAKSLAYLLTKRERKQIVLLDRRFRQRFGREPAKDPNLIYYLGDNVSFAVTWSAVSGAIPCFRARGGKYWHRKSRRWLVAVERMAAMGFPVNEDQARVMGVSPVPSMESTRVGKVLGNSFHYTNAAVVLLCALCCFGRQDQCQQNVVW